VNPEVVTIGAQPDPLNPITGLAGHFNPGDLAYQSPMLVVVLAALLVILFDAFATEGRSRKWLMYFSVVSCLVGLFAATWVWKTVGVSGPREMFDGMLVADRFSTLVVIGVLAGSALTLLLSSDYLREHSVEYGEFYALVLLSAAGMMMMAMAADLVTVFLGIETMSLGVYVLTGSMRKSRRSTEAAMKYFLTGAFVSGILLYGIALVYGMAGTTSLAGIAAKADALSSSWLFLLGMFMILASFGFKAAAVPFHMWAPDAYEGAPTPVTAFMSAGVKAAGIATLLRVFVTAFGGEILPFGRMGWGTTLIVISALTMTIGNLLAIRQDNVKRMLAYSSISHAGYLLIGVAAAGLGTDLAARDGAIGATQYYLLAYTFTSLGAFGVVAWIGSRGDERLLIDDWNGLASRHPAQALAMTVFLLSLGGMPPLAGFFGKFYLLRAAMQASDTLFWLIVIAALNSVVSIYYYLRVVMAMYFREPTREMKPLTSGSVGLALAISATLVVQMGVMPSFWLGLTREAGLFGAATATAEPAPAAAPAPAPAAPVDPHAGHNH
jgi:NADH-quinone oxidoreductase subunit N